MDFASNSVIQFSLRIYQLDMLDLCDDQPQSRSSIHHHLLLLFTVWCHFGCSIRPFPLLIHQGKKALARFKVNCPKKFQLAAAGPNQVEIGQFHAVSSLCVDNPEFGTFRWTAMQKHHNRGIGDLPKEKLFI
jgi:hypothetical protein